MGKAKKTRTRERVHYHRDGSVWARGQMTADDLMSGYWEWFRKDGSKMRSGYFEDGEQVGEWITYDRKEKVVKVTQMKVKTAKKLVKKQGKKKAAVKKSAVKTTASKMQRAK
jgi:antitoxin component YwqK of YwqJK toxin-antitoxin module